MRTTLQAIRMAQAGISVELSPSELLDKISVETATKIVYIPVIVSRAAFEYADFACRLCAENRLDFRKQTRTIKEQVAEYERKTVGLVGRDIQEFLEGSVDSFFEEAHDHIWKLQMSVQQEMKKQWPELTDYSLLLNLYMCVILIDFVRRFEQASSKVIQKATMNPYVAIENENLLHIRKACIEIAGKYKLPNTDMIRLGVKILAMNIDKMVKVEYDKK